MPNLLLLWFVFIIVIITMLIVDLMLFHREAHEVKMKEALIWSGVWIALALLFDAGIYIWIGHHAALKFLTGFLVEKSLSMDNLFVFLVIFSYFGISAKYQHKVLYWGIIGAFFTRGLFIATGVVLVQSLHWIIYLFGIFLVYTGIKLAFQSEETVHPEKNIVLKIFKRFMRISEQDEKDKFFSKRNGILFATPLFVTVLVIETTDVVFALDSIPAILGITVDPFIVYTSNIFAILGLRALYFALAGFMKLFRYLHYGLSIILVFIGVKMLLADVVHIPVEIALAVVGGILIFAVIISIVLKTDEE